MSGYILDRLKKIKNLKVDLVKVKNNFLGESVTVTGLLSGGDILKALKKPGKSNLIMLPPNCLNPDGFFLDDLKPLDLEKELGIKIVKGSYDLVKSLKNISPEINSGV